MTEFNVHIGQTQVRLTAPILTSCADAKQSHEMSNEPVLLCDLVDKALELYAHSLPIKSENCIIKEESVKPIDKFDISENSSTLTLLSKASKGVKHSLILPRNSSIRHLVGRVKTVRRVADNKKMDLNVSAEEIVSESGHNIYLEFDSALEKLFTESEVVCSKNFPDSESQHLFSIKEKEIIELDGETLKPEELLSIGRGHYRIGISESAKNKVRSSRKIVDDIVSTGKVVYGITTGFGKFASTVIDKANLMELQVALIRSHAAGVGEPLGICETRMLFALRINVLCKGYSGISLETLDKFVAAFNESCLPWVPERGTVGASGDLAPLAHLALGMIAEGKMWSPNTGWTTAKHALTVNGLEPIELKPKEGLCLINGTQLITSIGTAALVRAEILARQADIICALSIDALRGTCTAFDPDVSRVRPYKGQADVARRLRMLLKNDYFKSEIAESHKDCGKVQDAYVLRCCPQVHGITHDTLQFVRSILSIELNSATDNPLVFSDRGVVLSAGNFHGEYPAKVLDYLAIAVHELASVSERRIERLVNPMLSGLPAFLTPEGGLNSGFMMAHVTAASLVSENKVLSHPSSVDSLSTSASQEDHVSMGGFAARKALKVVEHVEYVLAIELLAAVQAIDFLRPLKSTAPLEAIWSLVRSHIPHWEKDRFMAPDIELSAKLIRENKVWNAVEPFIREYEMQHLNISA